MPKGVPVATVGIGNATNAGLLAARIIAASNPELLKRVLAYQVILIKLCAVPANLEKLYSRMNPSRLLSSKKAV